MSDKIDLPELSRLLAMCEGRWMRGLVNGVERELDHWICGAVGCKYMPVAALAKED